MPDGVIGIFQ